MGSIPILDSNCRYIFRSLVSPRNWGSDIHKILGTPHYVQLSDKLEGTEQLLFQIDTDIGLGLIIGDCGNFQIFIEEDDLARKDFSKTRLGGGSH